MKIQKETYIVILKRLRESEDHVDFKAMRPFKQEPGF